ncbi:MAG: hypothetical protein QOI42_83 [Frankiaceae bacterium]|nr:hypothetical protein [Frankiaceae bacterium]
MPRARSAARGMLDSRSARVSDASSQGDTVTARPTRREALAAAGLLCLGAAGGVLVSRRGAGESPPSGSGKSGPTAARTSPTVPGSAGSPATATASSTTAAPVGLAAPSLVEAYAAEHQLVARYEQVVRDATAAQLAPVLADHRRHLDAFAAAILAADPSWTPQPLPPAAASPTPPPRPSPGSLAALERSASAALVARVAGVDGDLAGLFASVAASEAGHAQVVGALRWAAAS